MKLTSGLLVVNNSGNSTLSASELLQAMERGFVAWEELEEILESNGLSSLQNLRRVAHCETEF